MSKRFPITPAHPERVCWGCDRYCPATSMICGNGTIRTPHPAELFGDDWREWGSPVSPPVPADLPSPGPDVGVGLPCLNLRPDGVRPEATGPGVAGPMTAD